MFHLDYEKENIYLHIQPIITYINATWKKVSESSDRRFFVVIGY
jgi:hypothetical protein